MKLPLTILLSVLIRTPSLVVAAMTLPGPIVVAVAPFHTRTPSPPLPSAAPAAVRPIQLFAIVVLVVPATSTITAVELLPEITLRDAGVGPPSIVLVVAFVPVPLIWTPILLGSGVEPFAPTPI